jgi:hypothetical protein
LPRGATVIGRSLECNLTIEDPLVSRQHARIVINDVGETVEDLGSRNGVRVNGVQIKGPTPLHDGDRVRIGTQDFVFCRVDPAGKGHSKTTGVLRLCSKCHLPYPRESVSCPNCEATEQTDEETLSGSFGHENQSAWTVQLLVEALERALSLGRIQDAERIVRRATGQVEELLGGGGRIDPKALATLAVQAAATTIATNDPTWVLWVIDVYRRAESVPPLEVIERVQEAGTDHAGVVRISLEALLERLRASKVGEGGAAGGHGHGRGRADGGAPSTQRDTETDADNDAEPLARLEQLRRLFEEETDDPSPTEITGEWPRPT